MRKIWRLILAFVFLIVGLAGLVLPIIPGLLFILLSFLAFSTVYEPAGRVFDWLEGRHPELHKHVVRWQQKLFPDAPQKGSIDIPKEP
jgi:uncharacterized membrane protein YbaN (DUF454 family)